MTLSIKIPYVPSWRSLDILLEEVELFMEPNDGNEPDYFTVEVGVHQLDEFVRIFKLWGDNV
jgi:hypothetical protein